MQVFTLIVQITAVILGIVAGILSIPLFLRFSWPSAGMWLIKMVVSSLATVLALISVFVTIVGALTGSAFITLTGFIVFCIYVYHIVSITRPPDAATGFEQAFGEHWEKKISRGYNKLFLESRNLLRLPHVRPAVVIQNKVFATIPGTGRSLKCDLWQPPRGKRKSGLAFIYFHGGAFYILDKDFKTRRFFNHLASQGHLIMDVAYRLAPETNFTGMVHDVKRAIAWMKDNASRYGINPDSIIVAGGSAGATLALLAGYTSDDISYSPSELVGKDLGVAGIVSYYGPADLKTLYYHTRQHLFSKHVPGKEKIKVLKEMPPTVKKAFGEDFHRLGFDKDFENIGSLAAILGGHPDECPEEYKRYSPLYLVHSNCPPTLLIHGEHDILAPVQTTQQLFTRLKESSVPVVMHLLPQTDHGFDLSTPVIAPAAHNALFDVERFLGLIASNANKSSRQAGDKISVPAKKQKLQSLILQH